MAQRDYEEILHRENLTLANNKKRTLSFVIDDLLMSLVVVAAFGDILFNATNATEWVESTSKIVTQTIFIKFLYQTLFTWYYGATIGKIIMKIQIIELDSLSRPSIFIAMTRAGLRILSEMFFYLGFFPGFFDKLKQTLHDKVARTVVINV
jgi:uncharacterized RDD family membrane protein YckC